MESDRVSNIINHLASSCGCHSKKLYEQGLRQRFSHIQVEVKNSENTFKRELSLTYSFTLSKKLFITKSKIQTSLNLLLYCYAPSDE